MQAYYREHKINPLAAFFPLLIQIPIFISLYYLMRTDAREGLFGTHGFLFIPNLTDKPSGGVLIVLILAYLASQVSGSLIATRQMQGGQRKLMLALPMLFVGIVARFPAGLAVYWITTSLWTLGQQVVLWRLAPNVPLTGGPLTDTVAQTSAPAAPPRPPATPSARKRQSRKRKHGHGRRR